MIEIIKVKAYSLLSLKNLKMVLLLPHAIDNQLKIFVLIPDVNKINIHPFTELQNILGLVQHK